MSALDKAEFTTLLKKLMNEPGLNALVVLPATVYFMALITGLDKEQGIWTLKFVVPVSFLVFAIIALPVAFSYMLREAFADVPGQRPSAKLERILMLPRKFEVFSSVTSVGSITTVTSVPAIYFHKNLWLIPWTVVVTSLVVMLTNLQTRPGWERIIRPYAIREFHRNPEAIPRGSGFFWVRQRWYLPYAFGLFVVCARTMVPTVLLREGYNKFDFLRSLGASEGKKIQSDDLHNALEDFSIEVPSAKERLHPFFLVPILKRSSAGEGSN